MKLKIGKSYILKNGDVMTITDCMVGDTFNGETKYFKDLERWISPTGKHWNYLFPSTEYNDPHKDILWKSNFITRVMAFFIRGRGIKLVYGK